TYPQYLVLSALDEHDGLTIGAIADRLALESSTVTPPVKRMEQAGLLERRRSTEDERQVNVFLTDAGRDLLRQSKCLGDTLVERAQHQILRIGDAHRVEHRLVEAGHRHAGRIEREAQLFIEGSGRGSGHCRACRLDVKRIISQKTLSR
ncbi:MAG: MarR family transcriptional regulator, partial [Alphaproteobacteria bacterium]